MTMIQCGAPTSSLDTPDIPAVYCKYHPGARSKPKSPTVTSSSATTRRALSLFAISTVFSAEIFSKAKSWSKTSIADFSELQNSGGVKVLELRIGDGEIPVNGDQNTRLMVYQKETSKAACFYNFSSEVAIHYYGRLAAKQGWRFDSTYDHKDETGVPIPFVFTLGSRNVISGIDAAVRSMKVGGIRRVIIPPLQGYQNTYQEPIPPNFFDRQRLFTTIFNPTRLANGEGSTLGILIFDIELVSVRHQ